MQNNYRKKSNIRNRIISLVLLAVLILSSVYLIFGNRSKIESVTLGAVGYQDFSRSFFINADLEPVAEQNVELPASAKIKEIYVTEGEQVKKDDKLLLLDTSVWSKEKADLEAELTELEKAIAEQPDMSNLLQQGDLLGNLDLQRSLLNAFPSSFQLPDFSGLGNLTLPDIFSDQASYQQLLTLIDRALYLTEQVRIFTGQIRQIVDLLANFEPSPELAELLKLFKQQLEFWQNLQAEIIGFFKQLIAKFSDSEEFSNIVAFIQEWLTISESNQAEIEALIIRIEQFLKQIEAGSSDFPAETNPVQTDSTEAESALEQTEIKPNPSEQETEEHPTDPEETITEQTEQESTVEITEENVTDHNEPETFLIPLNNSIGITAKLNLLKLNPLLLTNILAPDLEQNLQEIMLQSGMQQGLNVTAQLEKRIDELDRLIKKYSVPIEADFPGLIAELNVMEDQEIEQNSIAIKVFSEKELIAVYHANKRDAAIIAVGQQVIYDYEDLDLTGEVIYKSPIAKNYNESFASEGMSGLDFSMFGAMSGPENILSSGNSVLVKMSIEGEDLDQIIIGFDIDCEVIVEEVAQVLSIPAQALWMEDDQAFVYTVESDRLVKKSIETGSQGAEYIEIISGLTEDDYVVLNPRAQYKEGQKVRINE